MSSVAAEYYKDWIAYQALQKAVDLTNYRTVWDVLACDCCGEPPCWKTLPLLPDKLDDKLKGRIRWYDHVQIPASQLQLSREGGKELTRPEIRQLQAHFVGHHQRIELILLGLKPSLDKIYTQMMPFEKNPTSIPPEVAHSVIDECHYAAKGWESVGELVRGVAKMDRMQYLAYVPRLAGVSGGNSPLMMPLTSKTVQVEGLLKSIADHELTEAIRSNNVVGEIAQSFLDLQDAVSRCWMDHVVTATTTIGITSGTKGTPNTILVDRVLKRLHGSRLLKALGSLRPPLSGFGIELEQLHDYQTYPLADHYLDLFDDPGPEFGSHSIGYQPRVFEVARQEFQSMRREWRTNLWEKYYSEIRPAFCDHLERLLEPPASGTVKFGFGSNVTEVLARLVASLSNECDLSTYTVRLAKDEFVTLQRAAISLARKGATLELVEKIQGDDNDAEEKKQEDKMIVFVSLVNSCTQRVQNLDWVFHVPETTVVVIDITQAIANVPLSDYNIGALASKSNVFLVGSLIKHARCGEGLGFLVCANTGSLVREPDSGWTAYLSGLRTNTTVDYDTGKPLYDDGIEWSGGTPGCVETAYVATRILESMSRVKDQHAYVQGLKKSLLDMLSNELSPEQRAHALDSASNTVAIPLANPPDTPLPFGLDCKVVNGQTYLRCGLGVHNLRYHLDALVVALKELKLF